VRKSRFTETRIIGMITEQVAGLPNRMACTVRPVDLKHILRQSETVRDNLRHDRSPLWILIDPPWHRDADGGAARSSEPFGAAECVHQPVPGSIKELANTDEICLEMARAKMG
jgi:hypothetical protein